MQETTYSRWLISDMYYPSESIEGPIKSHEAICVLNTNDQDAGLTITLYFEDREPMQLAPQRCPARRNVQLFAGIENLNQPILGAAAQCFLQKQIAAGIAGQGKLRQAEQFGSGNSLCAHGGNDLLRIVGTVSNMQRRADGCCVQKSVFHG